MDRCALFVDAGYLLADGAMAVHGTRHREAVSWDFAGLLQLLSNLGRERTGLPLLRCYWYEATVEGRRSPEHEALADLPGLKLRLGRIRPGRREGVDAEIQRDLMTLARNRAIADAVLVGGDEDMAPVVAEAQEFGVRVTVVHVAVDGNWTISRVLRQECDDLIEIGAGHLRPYVNLISGLDQGKGGSVSPLSNGHGSTGSGGRTTIAPLQTTGPLSSPPPGSPITGQPVGGGSSSPTAGATPTPSGNANGGQGYGGGMRALGGSALEQPSGPPPPSAGFSGAGGTGGSSAASTGPQLPPPPVQPSTAPAPASPPAAPGGGTGPYNASPAPAAPPSRPSGPQPAVPPAPYNGPQQLSPVPAAQQNTPTLADAVKAAHKEGQDFGESVARDAPALWLEAVLARKPRMPSDLEARLLQGSSLPIDFLLHDEVRHALRRGFWDALERSRR